MSIIEISTMDKIISKVVSLENSLLNANKMLNSENYINNRIGYGETLLEIQTGLTKYRNGIVQQIFELKLLFNTNINNFSQFSIFVPFEI